VSKLRRLAAMALSVLAAAVMGLGAATAPAHASGPAAAQPHRGRPVAAQLRRILDSGPEDWCGNAGTGYCLNDWNGTFGDVKMYYGGYTNDLWIYQPLYLCPGGVVASNCPFSNTHLDNVFLGDPIFQLESYVLPGWCIGSSTSSSLGIMQPCNNENTGTGGGTGTVWLFGVCSGGGDPFGNRYWSARYNTPEWVESGNALYAQPNLDFSGSSPTCWH